MSKDLIAMDIKHFKHSHLKIPAKIILSEKYRSFIPNLLGSYAETSGNLFFRPLGRQNELAVNTNKQPTKNNGLSNMS